MVSINLASNGLSGSLPDPLLPGFGSLSLLDLRNNDIGGTVPMIDLPALTQLWLFNNLLVGPLPDRNLRLPSLVFLDVQYNSLAGALPRLLDSPRLTTLNFDSESGVVLCSHVSVQTTSSLARCLITTGWPI